MCFLSPTHVSFCLQRNILWDELNGGHMRLKCMCLCCMFFHLHRFNFWNYILCFSLCSVHQVLQFRSLDWGRKLFMLLWIYIYVWICTNSRTVCIKYIHCCPQALKVFWMTNACSLFLINRMAKQRLCGIIWIRTLLQSLCWSIISKKVKS